MGLGVAGSVALGSAVLGAGTSLYGASQAAGSSKAAADQNMKLAIASVNRLQPYINAGYDALGDYSALARSGPNGGGPDYLAAAYANQPGQMTQAQLEQTPGYQFNLAQGLQATQNAAAARGLGVSGAALKGAAKYATGLADSTYQNQFNNAQTRFQNLLNLNTGQQGNLTNQFNRLSNVTSLGENAAAGAGNTANAAGSASSALMAKAGEQSAAGTLGVGNAISGAGQNYLSYNALQDYINKDKPAANTGTAGSGSLGGYPVQTYVPGSLPGNTIMSAYG